MTRCRSKIFFIGFFISISSLYSHAQNRQADSLKVVLSGTSADTLRVYYMYKISDAYSLTELSEAWKYADSALKLAQKIQYQKGEARSHTRLGNIFNATGQFDTALAEHLISLELCEKMKDVMGVAAAYNNIALMYTSRSLSDDYKNAIENFKEAKKYYEKLKDSANLTTVLFNIGDGFEKMGRMDSAFIYANMAKKIALKQGDHESLGVIFFNLGSISYKSGRFEEAVREIRGGIQYMTAVEDNHSLSMAWSTYALCFKELGKIDSFEFYAKKAIEMGNSTSNHAAVLEASNELAKHYAAVQNYPAYYQYKELATTKDSIINSNKRTARIEQLKKQEEIRQVKKIAQETAEAKARIHTVQKVVIVGFIVTLFIALIISTKKKANQKAIKALSFICLLLVFEFITFIIHPYIDKLTDHEPIYMVLILAIVAGLLGQLHHKLAHWLEEKLIHKRKHHPLHKKGQPVPAEPIAHRKPFEKTKEKQEKNPDEVIQKTISALPDNNKLNIKIEEKHPADSKPDHQEKL